MTTNIPIQTTHDPPDDEAITEHEELLARFDAKYGGVERIEGGSICIHRVLKQRCTRRHTECKTILGHNEDHGELYRMKSTKECLYVVHPYRVDHGSLATVEREYDLRAEVLPYSWYCPGLTTAIVFRYQRNER